MTTVTNARVIDKGYYDYQQIPAKGPFTNIYEVKFSDGSSEYLFELSLFEYNVLEVGDEGELVFEGNRIIRFADKINENYQ